MYKANDKKVAQNVQHFHMCTNHTLKHVERAERMLLIFHIFIIFKTILEFKKYVCIYFKENKKK